MRMMTHLGVLSALVGLVIAAPSAGQEVLFDNGAPNLWSATDLRRYLPADDFVLPGEPGESVQIEKIEFWVMDYGAFTPSICENDPDGMNCWNGMIEYAIFEDAESPDTEPNEELPEGLSWSFLKRSPAPEALVFESVDIDEGDVITIEATGRVGENVYLAGHTEYRVSFEPREPLVLEAGVNYWLGLHMANNYGPNNVGLYWETSVKEQRPSWCRSGVYESTDEEGNPVIKSFLDGGQSCQESSDCDVYEEGDGLGYCSWSSGSYEQREGYSLEERATLLEGFGNLRHLSTQDLFENFNDAGAQSSQLAFNLVPEPGAAVQALVALALLGRYRRRQGLPLF